MTGKIGITGASGFVGNNIVKFLVNEGYEVVAFGRNSERNFDNPKVKWKIMDLNDLKSEDLEGIDKFIHFAGAYNANDAYQRNVVMFKRVLEAAEKSDIKEFYMASTYAVFGNRETPARANDPYNPLEAYAMSKVMAEELFKRFLSSAKFKGVIIRLCSLYGKYGRNFVDVIYDKIKKKEEIQMVHFRNQFIHVEDFYEALKRIIFEKNPLSEYNIEGEITTEETLKEIFEELGVKYVLSEQVARSYFCQGIKVPFKHRIKEYLEEA